MTVRKMVIGLVVAILAGCATAKAPDTRQDVEFLRGCWVAKDAPGGNVLGFLRLLPEGAEGPVYQGYVQPVGGGEMKPAAHLSFARDGSHAATVVNGVSTDFFGDPSSAPTLSDGSKTAMFVSVRSDGIGFLVAAGNGDTLLISMERGGPNSRSVLFDGRRDGCD